MFTGAIYKYSHLYSDDYIADSCVKQKIQANDQTDPISVHILSLYEQVTFLVSREYFGFNNKIGYFAYDQRLDNEHYFLKITHIFKAVDDIYIGATQKNI